jgi:class 3 adenylate cyclase
MSLVDEGLNGSEARLWKLIEERSRESSKAKNGGTPEESERALAAIDRRIWDLFGEEWAVMFTDLSGFSRQVAEFGILHFLQIIHEQHKLLLPIVEAHDGLLIKAEGDSYLLLFRRPERALACARRMQLATVGYNQGRKPEERILLCVGIGFGQVLRIGDVNVWGREVNFASKLGEDTAKSGEVLVTGAVREALGADEMLVAAADAAHIEFSESGPGLVAEERVFRVEWR